MPALNGGWCKNNSAGLIGRRSQHPVKPLQRRPVEFAMRLSVYAGIQQQQIEPGDLDLLVERPGCEGIGSGRKRGAHQLARVMIAGNTGKRKLERRQQPLEILIFLGRRRVRQIARDHHEIGCRIKLVQCRNAAFQRLRCIDLAIGKRSRRLDVQIGNLGNMYRFWRHRPSQFSGGNRRTASGEIDNPIRSPGVT